MRWRHTTEKNKRVAVGRTSVLLGPDGEVTEANPDALDIIELYGAHAGFERIPEEEPPPPPRRRGRPRRNKLEQVS